MFTFQKQSDSGVITPTAAYQRQTIVGWRVFIAPDLIADHEDNLRPAVALLTDKLNEVNHLLPAKAVDTLQRGVGGFWLEWARDGHGAQYHPSPDYLREHGINVDKSHCVEISNLMDFINWTRLNQPMMLLHELAHAYHQQVLGFDNSDVRAAYRAAVASHKYDSVPYGLGGRKRAYALTDEKEYFAEISEAYYGTNDFYPYVRSELATFDPQGYALLESAWQVGSKAK